jgi:hypothetical protein
MIVPGQKIHTRQIDIATYEGSGDAIIVEGTLRDERLFDSYMATGGKRPPGTIHHMIIRMVVRGPRLVIEDIEVEMPTIPHDACIETLACLDPIRGMSIVSGFTAKVKALVGGTKGCYHLSCLLNAMAPAVVQGAWSALAREPIDLDNYKQMGLERVKNTCWVWREDGPLIQQWRARTGEGPDE